MCVFFLFFLNCCAGKGALPFWNPACVRQPDHRNVLPDVFSTARHAVLPEQHANTLGPGEYGITSSQC